MHWSGFGSFPSQECGEDEMGDCQNRPQKTYRLGTNEEMAGNTSEHQKPSKSIYCCQDPFKSAKRLVLLHRHRKCMHQVDGESQTEKHQER